MVKLTDKVITDALEAGKKITRKSVKYPIWLMWGRLQGEGLDCASIEIEDLKADDWEVVEDEQ